jgi:homoserine kinase
LSKVTSVEAYAPASMANLGIGFDILGLALQNAGDTVRAERQDNPIVEIVEITGDGGQLPLEADKNTVSIAASHCLKMAQAPFGLKLWIHKGLPLASGLGSSASSAVAGAIAANALLDTPFDMADLLPACLEGEAYVSGYHADNVAPSLLGGIKLITTTQADGIYDLPIPNNLYFALITPNIAVPTAKARAVLPKQISLADMIHQTGQVARLIDSIYRGDVPTMANAMESDKIVETARAHLIPHIEDARQRAKTNGALALVISGAGPTLCAICDDRTVADKVALELQALYDEAGIGGLSQVTSVDSQGARIISSQ